MAGFNGSGTFVRTYNWVTDKGNSVKVTASRMDTEDDGFATGLSNTITKDGQTTTTLAIPFAVGAKFSDGSAATPSINFINDTDCGLYRIGTNNIALSVAGAKVWDFGSATASVAGSLVIGGTLSVPTYGAMAADSIDLTGTASAAIFIATGEVRGASANFSATCSAAGFHATGLVTGASANFTATCAAVTLVASGAVNGASANFTSTCSAASFHSTGVIVAGGGLTVSSGSVTLPAGSVSNAALAAPGAWVYISKSVVSGAADIHFTSGIDSTYRAYKFVLVNVIPGTNANTLLCRVSADAGSNYLATGYLNASRAINSSGTGGDLSSTTSFQLTQSNLASGAHGWGGELNLMDPSQSTSSKAVTYHGSYQASDATFHTIMGGGAWTTNASVLNAIAFFFASGTVSGEIALYGLKDA